MARKSFTARPKTHEPIEIEINGNVFRCQPMMSGEDILDFMAAMDEDRPSEMAKGLRGFIDTAIHPDDLEAWKTYARDPENGIDLEMLSEIAGYVAEQYMGHPTTQPG